MYINTSGSNNNNNATNAYGVCLGLCEPIGGNLSAVDMSDKVTPSGEAGEIRTFAEGELEP